MPCNTFFTKIAGVTFLNANGSQRQGIIKRCEVGEELNLVREPDNSVDANAVKVLRGNGEQLGYLPAHIVDHGLAKDLDRGVSIRCRISNLTGGNERPRGVNIELTEGDWGQPARADTPPQPKGSNAGYFILAALGLIVAVGMALTFLHKAPAVEQPPKLATQPPALNRPQIGDIVKVHFGQLPVIEMGTTSDSYSEFTKCLDRPGVITCVSRLLDGKGIRKLPSGTKAKVVGYLENPYRASVLDGQLVQVRILAGSFRGKTLWTLNNRISK